jgi:hypothetical protein
MREDNHNAATDGGTSGTDKQQVGWLEEQDRCLEKRLAHNHSELAQRIGCMLTGPQREMSAAQVEQETERLLSICTEEGVEAVLAEVCTCRELLESLAQACHKAGMTQAGQYLSYLATPWWRKQLVAALHIRGSMMAKSILQEIVARPQDDMLGCHGDGRQGRMSRKTRKGARRTGWVAEQSWFPAECSVSSSCRAVRLVG